jgi:chaperonin GroEL
MRVLYENDSRDKILEGVEKLSKAIKVTLGPNGRYVILKRKYNTPFVTNDGASIARMIELDDEGEMAGLMVLRDASTKVDSEVGDGTTTTVVIASKLIKDASEIISKSILANPVQIRKEIEDCVPVVLEELLKLKSDKVNLKDVALISSKDEEIAELVSSLLKDNLDMEVILDDSQTSETYFEKDNGFRIKTGSISTRFLDGDKNEFENPFVLLIKGRLLDANLLREVAEKAVKENRGLVVVADKYDVSVVQQVIMTMAAGLKVVLIESPDFGEARVETFKDIEALTGAKYQETPSVECLGEIKSVKFDMNNTVFVGGSAEDRIRELEQTKTVTEYEKEKLNHRISRLKGGVATIFVGGKTEVEQKQRKPRIEDAVRACKSAKDGVVSGGGVALLRVSEKIDDSTVGGNLVKQAIREPFTQIAVNCGLSPAEIESKLVDGYDFKNNKYVNAIEEGIVDPFNVTKSAFESAISAAKTILTSDVLAFEEEKDA